MTLVIRTRMGASTRNGTTGIGYTQDSSCVGSPTSKVVIAIEKPITLVPLGTSPSKISAPAVANDGDDLPSPPVATKAGATLELLESSLAEASHSKSSVSETRERGISRPRTLNKAKVEKAVPHGRSRNRNARLGTIRAFCPSCEIYIPGMNLRRHNTQVHKPRRQSCKRL